MWQWSKTGPGAIADALAPSLLPKYYIAVETRTYRDSINYQAPVPPPALVAEEQAWMSEVLGSR